MSVLQAFAIVHLFIILLLLWHNSGTATIFSPSTRSASLRRSDINTSLQHVLAFPLYSLPLQLHHRKAHLHFHIQLPTSPNLVHSKATMLSLRTCIIICAFLAICTLTYDDISYFPPFFGPLLDIFFERDVHDPFVSGSGYTLFIDDNWKTITEFFNFLITLFWSTLVLISLPPIIVLLHFCYKGAREAQENSFDFEKPYEMPPRPNLRPARDTRYMTLGGDGSVIWVCGVDGGFEDVIDGNIEGAIARRWRRMGRRQFA
jgi:hypothetical protein